MSETKKKKSVPGRKLTASYVFWFVPLAAVFVLMMINAVIPVLAVAAVTFALLWILIIPATVCAIIGVPLMLAHFAARRKEIKTTGNSQQKRFGLGKIVLVIFVIVLIISAIQFFVDLGSSDNNSGNGVVCRSEAGGVSCG